MEKIQVPFSSFSRERRHALMETLFSSKYLKSSKTPDAFIESFILFLTKFKKEKIGMILIFDYWFDLQKFEKKDLIIEDYQKGKLTQEHIDGMKNVMDVLGVHYFVLQKDKFQLHLLLWHIE